MYSVKVNNMVHPRSKRNIKTYKPDDIIFISIDENPGKSFFKLPKCKNKSFVIKTIIYAIMKFVTYFILSYLKGLVL